MENIEELYKRLDTLKYSIKLLRKCINQITENTVELETEKEEIERKLDKIRLNKD